jgi:photosystem II stability/assembly factor-like uncharacterized protein
MKLIHFLITFIIVFSSCKIKQNNWIKKTSQQVEYLQYGPDTIHARGIAIYKNQVFTANSNGFAYRYDLNTKKSTQLNKNPYPELRDISVFDSLHYVIMQSNDSSVVSTIYSGKEMKLIPEKPTFFDGIDFNKKGYGILMGDPIDGKLQVYTSTDFGEHWTQSLSPTLDCIPGEAGFAASGTTVQLLDSKIIYFVTGGIASNLYKSSNFGETWTKSPIPFENSEASGPFSFYFQDSLKGICVGGDYSKPNSQEKTCFYTVDGGKNWHEPKIKLSGYRSSITYLDGKLFAGGTNGIDVSFDFGKTWKKFSGLNTLALNSHQGKLVATTLKGQFVFFGQ